MADSNFKTGEVRLSFVNIFEPRQNGDEGEAKYSVMLIIDKKDKKTIDIIEAAVEAAKVNGKEKVEKWKGKVPGILKHPLRDGDVEREDDPNLAGKYFMNLKTKNKPGVVKIVGGKIQPVTDPAEVYSGCYAKVTGNMFGYAVNGNNGIAAGLNNILFVRDGEPLGGTAPSAMSEFAEEQEEAGGEGEDWAD